MSHVSEIKQYQLSLFHLFHMVYYPKDPSMMMEFAGLLSSLQMRAISLFHNNIPSVCGGVQINICCIFSHLSINRQFPQKLAVVNNTEMNMVMEIAFCQSFIFPLLNPKKWYYWFQFYFIFVNSICNLLGKLTTVFHSGLIAHLH